MDLSALAKECEITYLTRSGPGGQRRNRKATAVRVVHRPTGLSMLASERRSQAQNRLWALRRLAGKIERLRARPRPRLSTEPSRSAKRRRVEAKRRRGFQKRTRAVGAAEEW